MVTIVRFLALLVLVPSLLAPLAAPRAEEGPSPDVAIALRLVDESRVVAGRPVNLAALRKFYAQRGFQPVWLNAAPRVQAALAVFRDAQHDGLTPADYHPDAIAARLGAAVPAERAELELLVTDAVIAHASHLRSGRVAPKSVSSDFAVTPPANDPVEIGNAAAAAPDLAAWLAGFAPARPEYTALKAALARHRALEKAGGWPAVPAPRTAKLEPGMRDPMVRALRQRLTVTGEYDGKPAATDTYDPPLRKAVERFQARHGLLVDGTIGAGTVTALNVTVADRIAQIIANLERVRWMPGEFGARHVMVNIPDFTLRAVDNGRVVEEMRVVVGTKMRQTPIFSSTISSVVLNPTWTVPVRLAKEDYLPKLLKDPNYLASKNIRVYASWAADAPRIDNQRINWKAVGTGIARMKLRQDPGPDNALGRMKFNIRNDFDVYLHDTPSRDKFDRTVRTFSSGCVRVGDPLRLAAYVFDGTPEWPVERRQQVLDQRETKTVILKQPVAVHLLYQTAWVDAAGAVQFRDDVYGRDGELLDAIARRSAGAARVAQARS